MLVKECHRSRLDEFANKSEDQQAASFFHDLLCRLPLEGAAHM